MGWEKPRDVFLLEVFKNRDEEGLALESGDECEILRKYLPDLGTVILPGHQQGYLWKICFLKKATLLNKHFAIDCLPLSPFLTNALI